MERRMDRDVECRSVRTDIKEYVGKGATAAEQRLNRARVLVAVAQHSENARKLKLSTRSNRLALLQRAAAKRRRKGAKRRLNAATCI